MSGVDHFQEIRNIRISLSEYVQDLRELAQAFQVTGNTVASGNLYDIANGVAYCVERIRKNDADRLDSLLDEQTQSVKSTLNALFPDCVV